MIILKSITETLRLVLTYNAQIDYSVSYADITTSTFVPSTNEGKVITGSTVTILDHPSASTQRQVKLITIRNIDPSVTGVVKIEKYDTDSLTSWAISSSVTLLAGETLQYMDGQGWVYYSATGAIKGDQAAAGGNQYIQFNNNGILAGDAGLTFDSTNEILGINNPNAILRIGGSDTDPANPPADTLALFARNIANRMLLAQVGPSGLTTSLQPILARNKVGYWNPPGNATTLPGVFGITALSANGTAVAVARTVATTNLATRMRRIGYPTLASAANTLAGARIATAQFSCGSGVNDGSGFMLVERWVESDPAPVSGRRAFHGMTSTTTAFAWNVEVNTLLNNVGICQLSSDSTQWYWQAAGSSAQAAVGIGTDIGAPGGNSTTAWELAIFAPNGTANTYYLQLTNISTGVTASRTVTGAAAFCPQSTTLLTWQAWATNNATALAVGIDICSLYIETDN